MTPQPMTPALRALEAAYRTERAKLVRELRRRVDDDVAADVVQEVFVRAARAGRFDQVEYPAAYLRRIARNLLIDRTRAAKSAPVIPLPIDGRHDPIAQPEQSLGIEAGEVMAACERAINAMSPKTRRVFLMSRVQEASYREIADQFGIGYKAVERHMSRALSLCRRAVAVRR
jgi:RNA polymerase sigma factor (sigma-70 family)